MKLSKQVAKARVKARDILRMLKINQIMDIILDYENDKKYYEKLQATRTKAIKVAEYEITKIDEEDPEAKEKKERSEKEIKDITESIKITDEKIKKMEEMIAEQKEKIKKVESGEYKVDKMALSNMALSLIKGDRVEDTDTEDDPNDTEDDTDDDIEDLEE